MQPTPQPSNTGIPCPECNFLIKVAIQDLLYSNEFKCGGCGLLLHIDRHHSRRALEMLQELHVAMRNVEATRKQSL